MSLDLRDLFAVFSGADAIHNDRHDNLTKTISDSLYHHFDMLMKLVYFKEFVIPYAIDDSLPVDEAMELIAKRQEFCDRAIRELVAATMAHSGYLPYDLEGDIDLDANEPLTNAVAEFLNTFQCQCPECLGHAADEQRDSNVEDHFGVFVDSLDIDNVQYDDLPVDDAALYPGYHGGNDSDTHDFDDYGNDTPPDSDDNGGGNVTINVRLPGGW
jgi:hypothetical protein